LRIAQGAREDDPRGDSSGENDPVKNDSRGDSRPRPSGKPELPTTPVTIHADADLYVGVLKAGESVTHTLAPNCHAWLQVIKGSVELNGKKLTQGDGASASNELNLEIQATADAEVLLFDLA